MTEALTPAFWKDGNFGEAGTQKARVLFGQTRDDVEVERLLALQHGEVQRALVITSGGCGPMSLVDVVSEEILSVDINPAQNWLTELKLAIWESRSHAEFQEALFGNAVAAHAAVRQQLSLSAQGFWDSQKHLLRGGLQGCGSLDGYTRRMVKLFFATVHSRKFVESFLSLDDTARQQDEYAQRWDSWRWRFALGVAFHPAFLRLAFNRTAGFLLPEDFARLMREKLAHWLTAHPAAKNAALWQAFFQRPPPDANGWLTYLQPSFFAVQKSRLRKIHLISADLAEVLAGQQPGSLDFISLSNILELVSPGQCARILDLAARATAPGGCLLSRAILPQKPAFDKAAWTAPQLLHRRLLEMDHGGLSLPTLLLQRRN